MPSNSISASTASTVVEWIIQHLPEESLTVRVGPSLVVVGGEWLAASGWRRVVGGEWLAASGSSVGAIGLVVADAFLKG